MRLEANGLRDIRFDGHEIVRAVYFAMRDESWQTFEIRAHSNQVALSEDSFHVEIEGTAGPNGGELAVKLQIDGRSSGQLVFGVEVTVQESVATNRTGIVVLHPLSLAGTPVTVTASDGGTRAGTFPELIDPYQPFMSFNGLRHDVMDAVSVDLVLRGDVFEMEDQRNWSDASFKTYSRPIGLPWPYTLAKGEVLTQSFTLEARSIGGNAVATDASTRIAVGSANGAYMPLLGLGIDPSAPAHQAQLVGPDYVVAQVRADDPEIERTFARLAALNDAEGIPVVLELVLPCDNEPRLELARVRASADAARFEPEAIMLTPAVDLKGVLPGSEWPACPPLGELYAAAQASFEAALIGGGTLAFFTELNRKRPDTAALDFISFTTCPIVHAADDISVMQTLACLTHIARTTHALFGDVPFWVGPSSIGARMNPYGAGTAPNPARTKIALTHDDVRQFEPFAAAWALGYIAAFAAHGAARMALSELTGPRGVTIADADGIRLSPLGHLLAGLAGFARCPLLDIDLDGLAGRVSALALMKNGQRHVWIANLDAEPVSCTIASESPHDTPVDLDAYGIAHLVLEAA
ncbi:hypothetical protein QCE63_16135 [Caballeronia sp. LZ065]|uniref:hypothetical protein n=1 Tax=Caballeronia sp. LZ065 TaxID=3038571 RepID=UPI00285EAC2B|nr:hypothetical protein [Caballeronia sp. LZ065]MDR5780951.1 hypothetical protein [Caballeronia sp. LZ065]